MVLLEVEQKFSWTVSNFNLLRQGVAPRCHRPLHIQEFRHHSFDDIYYDSNGQLCNNGLWVRKRQPCGGFFKWQAKQLQTGSSFLRSTYAESEDPNHILKMVAAAYPASSGPDQNFGLDEFCRFQTSRHSFVVKEKFTVVLDSTDFGHRVGEVEIMAEDANQAHADIDALFKEHAWFFDTQIKPKGKLTAYFERFGYPKGC